jgi:hypothetical protein
MNHAIEMRLGAIIFIPSFRKTGSCIQKLIGGIYIKTHRRKHTHTHTGR